MAHDGNVEFLREGWQKNADGVGGGEKVDNEEIVGMRARTDGACEECEGGFLCVLELFDGVSDGPGIPVFEDGAFVRSKQWFDIGAASACEKVFESSIRVYFVKNLEREGCRVCGDWGRAYVVDIFV